MQGTYECFAEIARRALRRLAGRDDHAHRRPRRDGRRAAAGGDDERRRRAVRRGRPRSGSQRRLETRYLDELADRPRRRGRALPRRAKARAARARVGLRGNAADVLAALLERGFEADIVTDQTSAHDPLVGYVPDRMSLEEADALRARRSRRVRPPLARRDGRALRGDGRLPGRAAPRCSTTATACAREAKLGGFERAFDYPGFVPAYIRPLFCEGKGPFRWVALSGDPADIAATDRAVLEEFPDDERPRAAGSSWPASGSRSRACRRASAGSATASAHRLGLRFNEMVRSGELKAPIVIGRDHLDSGSVASPYRETEAMADGSDAIADWPLLNALVNTVVGRVVGERSTTAAASASAARSTPGMVCVADGTDLAAREARARADHRPGHGRHPPRRRRLRAGGRGGRRSAACAIPMREMTRPRDRHRRRSGAARAGARGRRRGAALAGGAAADRRPDRHDARGERRRPRRQPGRRDAADRGRRGRADNPRYPYKPPIPLTVIVNPVIEPLGDETVEINEGCLSVPDLRGDGRRATSTVRVRYLDRDGERARGGAARADRRHVPARGRPPRRRAVPRPRADPTTFTTWEQFERHRGSVRRPRSRRSWSGSARDSRLVRARLARRRRRAERGRRCIEIEGERIAAVTPRRAPPTDAERLAGLTLPGLANAHSHAFQRALRGRTHAGDGLVLDLARADVRAGRRRSTPTPASPLARATFAEMALAGITCVGEFHYLHHAPDGTPYDDPNAMGRAVLAAARGRRASAMHAARRLLPARRHRAASATATPHAWAERVDAARRARAGARSAPRSTACARSTRTPPRVVAEWARARRAAARARLRAAGGERGHARRRTA